MPRVLAILFGAAFTVSASFCAGRFLLARLKLELYAEERALASFIAGAASLSALVFALAAAGAARPGVFLALGAALIALGARARPRDPLRLPDFAWRWKLLFLAVFLPFTALYLAQAIGPEYSPDGASYHLWLVAQYLRQGGFGRITTSIYANLSQGLEMLFLFAFAFGRHSAAALTHLAFLIALVLGMVCYGRRFGSPPAAIAGALIVYCSPVAGFDATAAYNDVALACVIFFLFYLLEISDLRRESSLLVLAGLLAGFAYAVKYTAFAAAIYAALFVWWRARRLRPAAIVGLSAALMILPWMAKNWLVVGNPFSPFLNAWFPNPYTNQMFERDYIRMNGIHRAGFTWAASVMDVTTRGSASRSLLGPVFLLSPIALLALGSRRGRRLLAAAVVFGVAWLANVDARFLIPAAPFLALGLGFALDRLRWAIPLVVAAHAILSWPSVAKRYCSPHAMRVNHLVVAEALRKVPEETVLTRRLQDYKLARLLEQVVPPGGRVFSFITPPRAYMTREVMVNFESSSGQAIEDVLMLPMGPASQPRWRLRFAFPPRPLRAIRVVETASRPAGEWCVGEIRVLRASTELAPAPQWRLTAGPNPWDAKWAFDRNPVTRWRSLQPPYSGMYVAVDFAAPLDIDAVAVDSAFDQWNLPVRLEGRTAAGPWQTLSAAPERSAQPAPPDLRRQATAELERRGITHLLIRNSDYGADDFRAHTTEWNMELAAATDNARLYKLKADR